VHATNIAEISAALHEHNSACDVHGTLHDLC
jgi:hypothetical protein